MDAINIKNMTKNEKIQTMELLWDSLIEIENEIQTPEWHKSILNQRMQKVEDGTAEFYSLDEIKSL